MTNDDFLKLIFEYHGKLLLSVAVKAACGNWQDAEEGLNDAMRELSAKVVEHFKAALDEGRTDAKKAILPVLWLRIRSRAQRAHSKTVKYEMHLDHSVPIETLDNEPANPGDDSHEAAVEKANCLIARNWNRLSPNEMKVIWLTILREPPMTDDEAAKEIGKTPENVRVIRCRAIRKLNQ
jgi:RNA polymerase sigma factor (sigma-70 family)